MFFLFSFSFATHPSAGLSLSLALSPFRQFCWCSAVPPPSLPSSLFPSHQVLCQAWASCGPGTICGLLSFFNLARSTRRNYINCEFVVKLTSKTLIWLQLCSSSFSAEIKATCFQHIPWEIFLFLRGGSLKQSADAPLASSVTLCGRWVSATCGGPAACRPNKLVTIMEKKRTGQIKMRINKAISSHRDDWHEKQVCNSVVHSFQNWRGRWVGIRLDWVNI